MNATLCTCGVLTGGARDPHVGCPVHNGAVPDAQLLERINVELFALLEKRDTAIVELISALKYALADAYGWAPKARAAIKNAEGTI